MTDSGPFFYDNPAVFKIYLARRQQETSANETLEKPVLLELIGDVAGQDVLDLGCGEATIGPFLLRQGCRSYLGVDGSENMVALAHKALQDTPGRIEKGFIESWAYPDAAFDLVISRLAFHYIEDLTPILARIHACLRPGGRLVFSVEHPVITSHHVSMKNRQQEWIVDRYFVPGKRVLTWLGGDVIKYHRTVETYFRLLVEAGFRIEWLRESQPQRALFQDQKLYQRRCRVPLMLFFAAGKA